jgi:hypothetical protein
MKKILLLILFIFVLNAGYSQLYQPFPANDGDWRQISQQFFLPEVERWDYEYSISGDSTINGINYHKIFHAGLYEMRHYTSASTYTYSSGPGVPSSKGYVGAYREDGQKHIYFCPADSSSEQLLYDFNLAVGDTLPDAYNQAYVVNTVFSIDSVMIGTQYHRRYNISETSSPNMVYVSLIEGIGSTFGLLETMVPVFEHTDVLMCHTRAGATLFTDGSSGSCALPSAMAISESNRQNTLIAFPNPSGGLIHLKQKQAGELYIENLLGDELFHVNVSSETKAVDLSQLPKGIYILKIRTGKQITRVQKIIFQ